LMPKRDQILVEVTDTFNITIINNNNKI